MGAYLDLWACGASDLWPCGVFGPVALWACGLDLGLWTDMAHWAITTHGAIKKWKGNRADM